MNCAKLPGLALAICSTLSVPAQTVSTWVAPTPSSVFWSNTTAWSTAPVIPQNGQPAAADTYRAVIGRVAGQTAGPRIDLNRVLSLNQLDFSDGIIRGIVATPLRQITVNGPFNWTGGTLDEIAATVANGGMTIGQLAGAQPTRISGHVLTNATGQTATHTAGTLQFADTGEILQDAGTFQNNGTFLVTGGGGIDDLTTGSDLENKFGNAGTFTSQSAGGVTYAVDVSFENTGTVNVNSGTLFLSRGGTATAGSFNVSGGAALRFRGPHTFSAPATFTGTGVLELGLVNGPVTPFPDTFTFPPNLQFPGHTIISGGTTSWDGTIALGQFTFDRGTLNLTAGTVITVTGPLRFSNNGSIVSGKLTAAGGGIVEGAATLNNCELTVPAGRTMRSLGTGRLSPSNGGRIVNNGTWEASGYNTFIGGGQFVNNGTLLRNGLASDTTDLSAPVSNAGTVNVQSGTLALQAVTSTAGTFNVANGATLKLGGAFTFEAATPISGAGTVEFLGGSGSVAGSYNIPGTTRLILGAPVFNGTSTLGTLEQTGGTAVFNGPVTITTLNSSDTTAAATVTFNGNTTIGSISQTGTGSTINFNTSLTIASPVTKTGGNLNIAAGKTLTLTAPLNAGFGVFGGGGTVLASSGLTLSSGSVELVAATTMINPAGQTAVHNTSTAGNLILTSGSIFDNRGTFLAQNNRLIEQFATATGQNFFRNSGTFTRDTATGTYTVEVDFENTGTVNVTTGRLTFAASSAFTQNSGTFRMNGGAVTKSGASMRFNGGALTGNGVITGAVDITGGTLAPRGSLTISSNLTLPSGSTLDVTLGGTTQGTQYDFVSEAGTAAMTLAGNLSISFASGFQSAVTGANTFTILTSTSNLAGAFANVASGARLNTADGLGSFIVTYAGAKNVVLSSFIANPAAPPPGRITGFSLTASDVTLTWAPFGNQTTYQIQTSTTMAADSWIPLGSPLTGGATTATIARPAGDPRRYFRVISP